MFSSSARALLRRPQNVRLALRNASSTSEAASNAASKAKESASQVASQASSGLSRVTSSGGSAINKTGAAVSSTLSSVGGRTGQLVSLVQSMIPPTLYYGRVTLELGKLIAQGRKMNIPDVASFQSYYQNVVRSLRNPLAAPAAAGKQVANQAENAASHMNITQMMDAVRNADSQKWASAGVVAAEVIGFFTVGEMLGRFKVIGYRGGDAHGHHEEPNAMAS